MKTLDSVQARELPASPRALAAVLSPPGLARLAGAYWRFLTRSSLGLIRVRYTETERLIVLIGGPLVLLAFDAPVYTLDGAGGSATWAIRGGLLTAGGAAGGTLRISVRRLGGETPGIRVEVAVLNFLPRIEALFGARVYAATQARIHALVTRAFLRSVARLDLERVPRGRRRSGG